VYIFDSIFIPKGWMFSDVEEITENKK
jgi:hypothetical protein